MQLQKKFQMLIDEKCDECLNKLKAFLILKDGLDDEKLLEQIKQTAKSNLEQVDVLKECKKSDL